MFGYIRAYKPELKFKDYDSYKGVYCSLCKSIGRNYGPVMRLTLSYDFTFFALLRLSLSPEVCRMSGSHCSFNPLKKCLDCGKENSEIDYTADVSVLLTYYKILDNIRDGSFIKKILYYLILPFFSLKRKKALKKAEKADCIIGKYMAVQSAKENNGAGPDEASDPTARMMSELLCLGFPENEELKQFGYFFGRWVYLIDAADDCRDDIKNGSFNPLKPYYGADFKNRCRSMLEMTAGEAASHYEKIELKQFSEITDNIIYYGTLAVMNKVLEEVER